jgi:ABC-type uncharacterized transport system permease subunit
MPLLWLRVATVLYGVGLIHAILMLRQRGERSGRIAAPAVGLGMVFHFVSLVETAGLYGYSELVTIRHAESALALIIALIFTGLYLRYKTASPAALIFPLIFLLTFSSALSQHKVTISTSSIFGGWILFHVCTLVFGYAMLFLSFVSSLLYLVLSRQLKMKQASSWASRMPALQEIDELGYKALLLGFPFMTIGLLAGSVVAEERFGASFIMDPKVLLSVLMWGIYLTLLYTRWSAGWRGRKAAYLASVGFVVSVFAWGANYLSRLHRFIAP